LEARSKSDVIMKTSEASFSTSGGYEQVFSRTYSSIRHVSLTFKVDTIIDGEAMALDGAIVTIFVDLPDGVAGVYHINSGNGEPLHHLEFDTNYWRVHIGKTTDNDCARFNIVTFEEA
jgi:hypothetical protein